MSLSHSPLIVRDGLVLCLDAANPRSYPKSGTTWSDLAGANNGTLTNGPTFDADNKGSIAFDGSNDYINVPYSAEIGSSSFTCSAWVYNILSLNARRNVVSRENTNNWVFANGYTANKLNFWIYRGGWSTLVSNTTLSSSVWYYYTVSYDYSSNTQYIYINGEFDNSTTWTGAKMSVDTNRLQIGKQANTDTISSAFGGYISSVSMYNRALTASEVLQNYNATRGRYGI